VISFGIQVYSWIDDAENGSEEDEILNAINALAQKLDEDFAALGNLITQQIQLVLQNEDTIALADAMAHSSTGMDNSSVG
jgi:hypothetical protein